MFRHLTGHAPSYFSDRLPGMLTSRITATSNAVFTVENMFVWNVLPPCIATVSAILLIGTVSLAMSAGLIVIAGIMLMAMFRLAAAGKPLHDDFADKAAAVDGEMVDVISNLPLVRAFCGLSYEHDRFDATVERELDARGRSLRYLEKLRLTGAVVAARDVTGALRDERDRGRLYDLVLVDPPYDEWARHELGLADLLPSVLGEGGLIVVETSERVEPELPLALVTTRRYGSARITVFSR